MRKTNYVVYSRGLLRSEGPGGSSYDYRMIKGRPTFYGKMIEGDIVTIFVYRSSGLSEKREYLCLRTEGGIPLKAKNCKVTHF